MFREWRLVQICLKCRHERKCSDIGFLFCSKCGSNKKTMMLKKGKNYKQFGNLYPVKNFDGEWLVSLQRDIQSSVQKGADYEYYQQVESISDITEEVARGIMNRNKEYKNEYTDSDGYTYKEHIGKWYLSTF